MFTRHSKLALEILGMLSGVFILGTIINMGHEMITGVSFFDALEKNNGFQRMKRRINKQHLLNYAILAVIFTVLTLALVSIKFTVLWLVLLISAFVSYTVSIAIGCISALIVVGLIAGFLCFKKRVFPKEII
ncbi:MAG: hypothetical protein AAB475_02035 [Patescibacteria group bacterium]